MVRTANPTLKTTSVPITKNERGFTLVEVLLVLAVMAFVLSLGLPAMQRVTSQTLNSTARKFIGTIRTIRNDAILLSNTHRLAIDIDKNTWWVELQKRRGLLDNPDVAPEDREQLEGSSSFATFEVAEKYAKGPTPLPDGVLFQGVFKEKEGLFDQGIAYINFFPNGYVESSILFLNRTQLDPAAFALELQAPMGRIKVDRIPISEYKKK